MKYKLVKSEEVNIPHYGLKVTAIYEMDDPEIHIVGKLFPQKIVFWHRNAPVELEADLVDCKFDVPHVWVGREGIIKRTIAGYPMITQNEVLFCPKTKDGTYFAGYSPEEQKAHLLTLLMPCKWARPENE